MVLLGCAPGRRFPQRSRFRRQVRGAPLATEFGRRLPVLCFHRVGPQVHGANPELTDHAEEVQDAARLCYVASASHR